MKKIIMSDHDCIRFNDLNQYRAIFAKKGERFHGMVVKDDRVPGWIIRTGGTSGAVGYHKTLRDCLESGLILGYSYWVEGVYS